MLKIAAENVPNCEMHYNLERQGLLFLIQQLLPKPSVIICMGKLKDCCVVHQLKYLVKE